MADGRQPRRYIWVCPWVEWMSFRGYLVTYENQVEMGKLYWRLRYGN